MGRGIKFEILTNSSNRVAVESQGFNPQFFEKLHEATCLGLKIKINPEKLYFMFFKLCSYSVR